VSKAIDRVVFTPDPFPIVCGSPCHREVKELLAAARNIYGYRFASLPCFLQQRHTYSQRYVIGKVRELDLLFLLP
jgi:hypothetical protein